MSDARDRYIRDHAPTMLAIQATRADPSARLDLDAAIRQAAALYDRLTAAGHTPDSRPAEGVRAPKSRKTPDHAAALPPEQAPAFERFYRAYWRGGTPKGKQRAAARWAAIAPDAALAERIIAAAETDAAEPRPPGSVRKYPEGWLSERRWEDAPAPGQATADPGAARAAEVRELQGQRRDLTRLHAALPIPDLAAQLAALDERLRALGVAIEPTERPRRLRGDGLRAMGALMTEGRE